MMGLKKSDISGNDGLPIYEQYENDVDNRLQAKNENLFAR